MNGIAPQQTGALGQIVFRPTAANHNRPQPQGIATAGFFDQHTSQQAANPAKTVEHHISGLEIRLGVVAADGFTLLSQKIVDGGAFRHLAVLDGQLADIDSRRPQLHARQPFHDGEGFRYRELFLLDKTHEPMRFQYGNHRSVHQASGKNGGDHAMLTIQLAD